jgi:UDP-N-acetylglucosamine--N-acetylmuramyl-(pentapeptide) pyrophosphoryl-undecaprenol N-acetylglucosamine transferase
MADEILTGLPSKHFPAYKTKCLGNPVRADFLPVRMRPYEVHDPVHLFVFGGSQGATALNNVMLRSINDLKDLSLEIVHQTGQRDFERVSKAYRAANVQNVRVVPFIDDMAAYFSKADIVLSRAGAMTLAELTVCGRPAILVPFPSAADDHQTANARILAEKNAAILLPQGDLSPFRLVSLLSSLLKDSTRLQDMANAARELGKPKAAAQIVDELERVRHVSKSRA